jgi:outer membrane protein assembly factor BamE
MPRAFRAFLLAAPLALGACSTPVPQVVKPYRIDIQQGNYVSQEMVAQLKPGMSKEQVRFVLGTPLVTDIFHADRWDYIYYRELPDGSRKQHAIAVHFEDGKFVRVSGDVASLDPAEAKPEPAKADESKPAQTKEERGFFGRMLEKIGF